MEFHWYQKSCLWWICIPVLRNSYPPIVPKWWLTRGNTKSAPQSRNGDWQGGYRRGENTWICPDTTAVPQMTFLNHRNFSKGHTIPFVCLFVLTSSRFLLASWDPNHTLQYREHTYLATVDSINGFFWQLQHFARSAYASISLEYSVWTRN